MLTAPSNLSKGMKTHFGKIMLGLSLPIIAFIYFLFTPKEHYSEKTNEKHYSKPLPKIASVISPSVSRKKEHGEQKGLQHNFKAEALSDSPVHLSSKIEDYDLTTVGTSKAMPKSPKWKKELDSYLEFDGDKPPKEFLRSLTIKNWQQARDALATAYQKDNLPGDKKFQDKFWKRVGEIGGKGLAMELLKQSDPAFTQIIKGWASVNPQAMFDYYAALDIKSPEVQTYLDQNNGRELQFIDQFSSAIIDELLPNSNKNITEVELAKANEAIDYFVQSDPMKGESLMREFTERVIEGRDKETLKQWVSGYKEPELQSATAQRVIESGAFDENPLEAVEFANSLESTKAKRSALSSAYARLAGGVNGHDPNVTAAELNAMENGWKRDFALNGFAHGLVHSDPDAAIEWASSISNENFRDVITKNITKRINAEVLSKSNSQEAKQD
mgnify:CR=1 FL=1|jgi:hypothetical protein|tara:strand:+ start:97 stop:1425 length:1329 start_codon:yes stop_codon:yes gene_type:complete